MLKHIFKATVLIISAATMNSAQTRTAAPAAPSKAAGVITDRRILSEGPLLALPRAGGTFVDPTFGTTIMRVTDESDGAQCNNFYSYWPTFNLDSTRFFLACDTNPRLYRFDPNNFQIVSKAPFDRLPGGGYLSAEDAIWSGTNANVLYGYNELKLYAYDVATKTHTLVKDFGFELPPGYLGQMSKSLDDNVFAFTRKNKDYKPLGYIVWRRDQNRILRNVDLGDFDEVQVDKSGRYIAVKAKFDRTVNVQIVDLQTGKVESLTNPAPD